MRGLQQPTGYEASWPVQTVSSRRQTTDAKRCTFFWDRDPLFEAPCSHWARVVLITPLATRVRVRCNSRFGTWVVGYRPSTRGMDRDLVRDLPKSTKSQYDFRAPPPSPPRRGIGPRPPDDPIKVIAVRLIILPAELLECRPPPRPPSQWVAVRTGGRPSGTTAEPVVPVDRASGKLPYR